MQKGYSDFAGDDTLALEYVKGRGYASFSSLRNVRDKVEPSKMPTEYFTFGTELHSRFLEDTVGELLSDREEAKMAKMLSALRANKLVRTLMATPGMKTEVQFKQDYLGLPMLGYIDIDAHDTKLKFLADLKSTHISKLPDFVKAMDFMQAALYLKMRPKAQHFYYLGICKNPPYRVMTFDAVDYATRLREANIQLENTINYVKEKTGLGTTAGNKAGKGRSRKTAKG